MAGIVILGVILLLLCLVLFTPILVRAIWEEEGPLVRLHIGPVKLQAYPPRREEKGDKPPKKKKASEKKDTGEKPAKKRKSITAEQILYLLETLPPVLGRALRRVSRRVRIGPLKIWLLLSAEDPADTALLYGRVETALMAALPILHRHLAIRDQDLRIYPDFEGNGTDWRLDVGVSIRLWDVLVIGLCAGGSGLKALIGMKRLGAKNAAGDTKTRKSAAGAADAA